MAGSSDLPSSSSEVNYSYVQKLNETRFEGFDFLRAIFSVAIVALKTNFFLLAEILVSGTFAYALMAEFAYFAVPVFLQLALFLLYFKSEQVGFQYFLKKRLPRLISLYVFWVGTIILFDVAIFGKFEIIKGAISSPRRLIEFIVSGGQTPFFFFFALTFLSTLAAILSAFSKKFKRKSKKLLINYFLLFTSCLLVFTLSTIEIVVSGMGASSPPGWARSVSSIAFWDYNPISFLPYLFTTAITTQAFNDGRLKNWSRWLKIKLCIIFSLTILFSILEWHLFEKLLHYSRLSLVFGSWLLLYLALLSPLRSPVIIKFLASCSLGIYGFHVFFNHLFLEGNNSFLASLFHKAPGLSVLVNFVLVLTCSVIMTVVFKRIKGLKNYV